MAATGSHEFGAEDWEMFRSIGRRIDRQQFEAFQAQGEQCGWAAIRSDPWDRHRSRRRFSWLRF